MVGQFLSGIVAASLVAMGVGAIVAPRMFQVQYGIELDDRRALAFLRAMGVRDLAIGLVFVLLLRAHARPLLAWSMFAIVPIAAVDLLIVLGDRRATGAPGVGKAPLLHAAGALGLLVTAVVLRAGV
jgi:uncharacterized protein DUF4267